MVFTYVGNSCHLFSTTCLVPVLSFPIRDIKQIKINQCTELCIIQRPSQHKENTETHTEELYAHQCINNFFNCVMAETFIKSFNPKERERWISLSYQNTD